MPEEDVPLLELDPPEDVELPLSELPPLLLLLLGCLALRGGEGSRLRGGDSPLRARGLSGDLSLSLESAQATLSV